MKSQKRFSSIIVVTALFGICSTASADAIKIGGAGAATEMIRFLGGKFAALHPDQLEVVPSLGSTGGLRAVQAGMLDIAIAGRALTSDEEAKGLAGRFAFRTPWGLATSRSGPSGFARTSIAGIYLNDGARWDDETAIRITLRPKGDSENLTLTESFPGMAGALEQVRKRGDTPIAATDQDNADWAEAVSGSLISITYTQLLMEQRKLRLLAIDGVDATFENFEGGRYPFGKTFYLVTFAQASPAALRFIAFLSSPQGQQALRETGNLPVTK
jgi:phosphate transport system substrate-binding protein